jgi:hypothetical protein
MSKLVLWKFVFVLLLLFLIGLIFVWYFLQEGFETPSSSSSTNGMMIRFPNYGWPKGSFLLVKDGVVQTDYFIKYIQTIIQNNLGKTSQSVSLSKLENLLVTSLNPTILKIIDDQYGGLHSFLVNNESSLRPFTD